MQKRDYDAIVVGSGPNGLAAAITMQQAGLSVLLLEAKSNVGGGLRTEELTLPGYKHDVCSAVHPLAAESPFFKTLPLQSFGLEYIYPEVAAAHPFKDGSVGALLKSIEETAEGLGQDRQAYLDLVAPIIQDWEILAPSLLGPLKVPADPIALAKFGLKAVLPATVLSSRFKTQKARGLWAGMAAHSIQPLSGLTTSAIGLVLMAVGHIRGWPIPRGGSVSIANALLGYFLSLGGKFEADHNVTSLQQLPSSHAVLFDITPAQLLTIAGHEFSALYKWQLRRYKYGMGVFKIDWALDSQIPFLAQECRRAGTVHIGNTIEDIAASEMMSSKGGHPDKPFILLTQPSVFDNTRAPEGKHVAWAYCHVPNGSTRDMASQIEDHIEKYAPGFKKSIVAKHTMDCVEMEKYNANYIGGDINGGRLDVTQLFTRPALRLSPYRTSKKGIYICSSSTPPGGGVHGMCGYHAAHRALKDIFNIK